MGDDITTTPYHPASNGMVERFHVTLAILLTSNLKRDPERWDDNLKLSVYAYNSSVHPSTEFIPFRLLFGKQVESTLFEKMGCLSEPSPKSSLETDLEFAAGTIKESQLISRRATNDTRPLSKFQVVDQVLIFTRLRKRQQSLNLIPSYSAHHRVTQVLSSNLVELLSTEDHKKRIENFPNLKKYFNRSQFKLVTEQTTSRIATEESLVPLIIPVRTYD